MGLYYSCTTQYKLSCCSSRKNLFICNVQNRVLRNLSVGCFNVNILSFYHKAPAEGYVVTTFLLILLVLNKCVNLSITSSRSFGDFLVTKLGNLFILGVSITQGYVILFDKVIYSPLCVLGQDSHWGRCF